MTKGGVGGGGGWMGGWFESGLVVVDEGVGRWVLVGWDEHNQLQPILAFAIKVTDFKLYFISSEGLLLVVLITLDYMQFWSKFNKMFILDCQNTDLRDVEAHSIDMPPFG